MNTKEIYKNYPVEVQEYMQNVIDCLVQDYKKIPSSRNSLTRLEFPADGR